MFTIKAKVKEVISEPRTSKAGNDYQFNAINVINEDYGKITFAFDTLDDTIMEYANESIDKEVTLTLDIITDNYNTAKCKLVGISG